MRACYSVDSNGGQSEDTKQELPFSIAMGVILLILGYSGMAISRADGLIFGDFRLLSYVDGARGKSQSGTAGRRGTKDASWLEVCAVHPSGRRCYYVGRRSGGGFGIGHCSEFWTEPEPYWFDDCSYGNFPAGAGDLCGCLPKRGSGYGPWKCIGSNVFNILMVLGGSGRYQSDCICAGKYDRYYSPDGDESYCVGICLDQKTSTPQRGYYHAACLCAYMVYICMRVTTQTEVAFCDFRPVVTNTEPITIIHKTPG